jgi:hypothetical protein
MKFKVPLVRTEIQGDKIPLSGSLWLGPAVVAAWRSRLAVWMLVDKK